MLDRSRTKTLLGRGLTGVLLVLAAGLVGYLLAPEAETDEEGTTSGAASLTVRTAQYATDLAEPNAPLNRSAVDSVIRTQLNRRVRLPVIDGTNLEGVQVEEIASGAPVPVLIYRDAGERIPVFVYNYALLDATRGELALSPGTLERLDRGDTVVDRSGSRPVILWRSRDDIFLAVASGDPDSLTARIERRPDS